MEEISKDYNEKLYQQERSINKRFGEIYLITRDIENTIKNTLSLSMDVNMNRHDPTWGVICYKHHGQDIVHKINLGNADGETVKRFIKDFESADKHIDCPPTFRNLYI